MKTVFSKKSFGLFVLLVFFVFKSCEKPERNSPWDEKATLSPSAWAPANLQITANSLSSITLSWTMASIHFEGFKIDRKVGNGQWEAGIATLAPAIRTFSDTQVDLTASSLTYRVYAYAGGNSSLFLEKQIQPTIVSTSEITLIAHYTAKAGGNVSSDALMPITARGVVWSTSQNPTIPGKVGKLNELAKDTLTAKSDTLAAKTNLDLKETKLSQPDTTYTVNSRSIKGLTSNGGYTINGSGTGAWVSDIEGLQPATTYYVRAYSTSSAGTAYGAQQTFTTLDPTLPTLTTSSITSITATTATSGGSITSDGGAAITAKGVVWSTSQNPSTTSNQGITNNGAGAGSFTSNLSGLSLNTAYYVRAYATNSTGTSYGNQQSFTTQDGMPVLTTTSVSNITATSASSGGNVSSDGGIAITARGVVWSTSQNPTTTSNQGITNNGAGTGSFTSNLSGLALNTTYYVRAYATNSNGTSYGSQQSFTTQNGMPVLTTTSISNITATSASTGGNISSDGGFAITARGVVWSTSQNPTTTSNQGITSNGAGAGSFTSNLSGLALNTAYYVRAYATNSTGTSYGSQQSFTTQDGMPVLTTTSVSNITATSASSGGNISSDGGFAITARGVVWSTSQNPTTTSNQGITSNGSGAGSFTSSLTNLQPSSTYYVRAYATNSQGTRYGNQEFFSTAGTTVVNVTNPATGEIWMDRNLGASRAATSSNDAEAYGDYYQWGRGIDGHQNKNSTTTSTLSSSDTPGHGNFIVAFGDWRSPSNNNLWQGVNGINNPCPYGYRLPTSAEWNNERLSWSSNNSNGAFASPLKLTIAGHRRDYDGYNISSGSQGSYWSSTIDGSQSAKLYFTNTGFGLISYTTRASGLSVRCIKH